MGNFRDHLRSTTKSAHKRVEAQAGLNSLSASHASYRAALEKLLGLFRPLDRALCRLPLQEFDVAYMERRKVQWLERDLIDLGHTAETAAHLPEYQAISLPRNAHEGLGVLYVLEGSSLGGQLILRELGPKLHVGPEWAGRFFYGYGKKTGAMWRSFLTALERASRQPEAASAIEASALATFTSFERHLANGRCPYVQPSPLNGWSMCDD